METRTIVIDDMTIVVVDNGRCVDMKKLDYELKEISKNTTLDVVCDQAWDNKEWGEFVEGIVE